MEDKIAQFKTKYMDKFVRVTTKNHRVFYGRFIALDDKANILLYETVTEIPDNVSHLINQTLVNVLDSKLQPAKYINVADLPADQADKLIKDFPINKFYFGPVMIAGADVLKLEIQRVAAKPQGEANVQEEVVA